MRVMKLAVIGSGMIVNEFLSIVPYLNNPVPRPELLRR